MSTGSQSPPVVTLANLNQLIIDMEQQSPKTLASWRLSNEKLVAALRGFAASPAGGGKEEEQKLLCEVLELFRDKMNPLLADQEGKSGIMLGSTPSDFLQKKSVNDSPAAKEAPTEEISVVFGGKHPTAGMLPATISESLVSKLVSRSSHVFTVSRSLIDSSLIPTNVTHIVRKGLNSGNIDVGAQEFASVMDEALRWREEHGGATSSSSTIVFYFTMGQHKGQNPFVRNIEGAQNFCKALEKTVDGKKRWRIVLTGTDATLPSTHPDGKVTPCGGGGGELVIPSYKIFAYNYVYAASKLCQYYLVIKTVAQLLGQKDVVDETSLMVEKLRSYVFSCKEDGVYHPDTARIKMDELDGISKRVVKLSNDLSDHVWIATGISICYTPLHAIPWTQAAMKKDSPRGDIMEQIVRRLKNAISIDKAADCHFPPAIRKR